MDRIFTPEEVAKFLQVTRETVIRLQAGGKLDKVATSTITNGISEGSLKAFMAGERLESHRMLL